jgi:hypothetical protein
MTAISDLAAGRTLRADNCPIGFSNHAVERMAERLGRDLDPANVRKQLSQMLSGATVTKEPPPWYHTEHRQGGAAAFLCLGDDVVIPLVLHEDGELLATTVITPGILTDSQREKRAAATTKFKAGKKASRRAQKRIRGRLRPTPGFEENDV